jgi:hypothetical protein
MPEETNASNEEQRSEPPGFGELANRFVLRSRKSLDLKNRPADEQSSFYLSAAQVYATLELAEAIRESNTS